MLFPEHSHNQLMSSSVLHGQNNGLKQQVLSFWRNSPQGASVSIFTRFLDHTRRTTVSRTSLDEWSAPRRDLYLTTHNTHNRQTPMPPVGFEPTVSAGERPQTYAMDRADTGTGQTESYSPVIRNTTTRWTKVHSHKLLCISRSATQQWCNAVLLSILLSAFTIY